MTCDCRTCQAGDDQWCCRICHQIAADTVLENVEGDDA